MFFMVDKNPNVTYPEIYTFVEQNHPYSDAQPVPDSQNQPTPTCAPATAEDAENSNAQLMRDLLGEREENYGYNPWPSGLFKSVNSSEWNNWNLSPSHECIFKDRD